MTAIKISNTKNIDQVGKTIVKVMSKWDAESDEIKTRILEVINWSGNATTNINNCLFNRIDNE